MISGPSGGGKTALVEQLRHRLPRLTRSISATTRPPRPGERNGRDYRFVSPTMFQRLRRTGQLIEWAKVHGAYYGTPRRPIERRMAQGRDVVLNIDVQGAKQVRRVLGHKAVLIFLMPPSLAHLKERLMRRRTDSPLAIRQRLAVAKRELGCATWYDYTVTNDQLQHAVTRVETIIRSRNMTATRKG